MIPKFRAWDTHEEVMNRVDYVDFVNGVIGMSNENVRDYEQPIHRVNIMQYTGLKDKTGLEIYIGDIVVGRLYNHGVVGWEYETKVDISDFSDIYELDNNSEEIEVVGNIYEHNIY